MSRNVIIFICLLHFVLNYLFRLLPTFRDLKYYAKSYRSTQFYDGSS